jgi:hypothetical protein
MTSDYSSNYKNLNNSLSKSESSIKSDKESENNIFFSNEEESIDSNSSSYEDEEIQITEYEKKYKMKFIINKKSLTDELKFNEQNLLEIEKEVIKNNYEYVFKNISQYKNKLLCNGKCIEKHNYVNIIKNIKDNKTLKTNERCYKNNLYYCLKNNMRGIKTIYNLLLRLIVIYPKYRKKCKCCISESDNELLKNFEIDFKNEKIINNTGLLYLNFLINKFLGIISLLQCECKFDKLQTYYTLNYCNYKDYFEIYLKTIPIIILLLKQYHNNTKDKYDLRLIKKDRCIHEDIRYYNNFVYCKYNKFEKELTDEININYIINNLEIINEWLKNNFKICNLLFNEQNIILLKFFIKNYENIESINNILIKSYKYTNIIDINYKSKDENLVKIILDNKDLKRETIDYLLKYLINKLKEINKLHLNYNINGYLLDYTKQCFLNNKYDFGLEFIDNIENLENNKIYNDIINYIINELLYNKEIEINTIVLYLKIINKNKLKIYDIQILENLIENINGDIIINKFNISDNIFINDNFKNIIFNTIENIINIIKKCLINKKPLILNYILYNLDDKIKNFNKKNNNIINPYQILFINKLNDQKEISYTEFIDIIQKYNYNINEDFNKNDNKFTYLNLCIKNNYIELGKKLINYNIEINNNIDGKSIIFQCIDYKNHLLTDLILKKNIDLGNKLYNNKNIINYLFEKDYEEDIKIKFLLVFIKNNFLNINYQDKINQNIGYLILKSNFNKCNKIILFKIMYNNIDPLIKNDRIPLIIYSMLNDEFEITYLLINKLIESKKILKTLNEGIFSYYLNNDKDELNYIPIILKYIRDYDKSKILDNDIKFNFIEDQDRCDNIFIIILKIICFFIKNIDFNSEKIKKYVKPSKTIIKIKYKKKEDINKYEELFDDNNNNILETDTMQNSNIWKTTTIETDSESSEIEVSKICFN